MTKFFSICVPRPFRRLYTYKSADETSVKEYAKFKERDDSIFELLESSDNKNCSVLEEQLVRVPVVGCRVRVNFHGQMLVGVVMDVSDTNPQDSCPESRIKAISECIDTVPYSDKQSLELARFAADYCHWPIGETIECAMPILLRKGEICSRKIIPAYRLADHYDETGDRRTSQQKQIIDALSKCPLKASEFWGMNFSKSALRTLIKKSIVEEFDYASFIKNSWISQLRFCSTIELNTEQADALGNICSSLGRFKTFLLNGVTGSGKTEVYMRAIEEALRQGKQALVMVPEISLTPQTIRRFHEHFNVPIAAMHSALSDADRLENYLSCRDGDTAILIGTRSSVFTPFKNLGIIIVDEEHDSSFRQSSGFRYDGRNLAVYRAKLANCPVVLGSATPSLETLANARSGKYAEIKLTRRAFQKPGRVQAELIDIRGAKLKAGLGESLLKAMNEELSKGNQAIVFLNRRGYASYLNCLSCGYTFTCGSCDSHLVYHKGSHRLECHCCDRRYPYPAACPDCGGTEFSIDGTGTEQIEEYLKIRFPEFPVARIDRDTMANKKKMQETLEAVVEKKYRILVGTQILAKGHHFPDVTLIALVNCDQALNSADFRASESFAQLYTQVAGRTGREEKNGKVILQTCEPGNETIQITMSQGYEAFANNCLEERRQLGLPPYSSQTAIRIDSKNRSEAHAAAIKTYSVISKLAARFSDVSVCPPRSAYTEKMQDRYLVTVLASSPSRKHLHEVIEESLAEIEQNPFRSSVRVEADTDPRDSNA